MLRINNRFLEGVLNLINECRTVVSDGSDKVIEYLSEYIPNSTIYEYPTGAHESNWQVPPSWNLKSAYLRELHSGKIIVSHSDSVMFVAPYSKSCNLKLDKAELLEITRFDFKRPDDYVYEHRLAYDPNRTLNEVIISIPFKVLEQLSNESEFELFVDTTVSPGKMKVFEAKIQGSSKSSVYLLSHFCHPGQLNDGLAGVYVMGRVYERILNEINHSKYTYHWLAFPETIGTSVYAHSQFKDVTSALFSIFSEMPGAKSPIRVTSSRRKSSYVDRIIAVVLQQENTPHSKVPFRGGWGNDEMVFDSPILGVPSISIDRAPFKHYHRSSDNLENFDVTKAEEIVNLIFSIIKLLEQDYIPSPNFIVPPQLSSLGLYADWKSNRADYDETMKLLDEINSGNSVIDIAIKNKIKIDRAFLFYERLYEKKLLCKNLIQPEYSREL